MKNLPSSAPIATCRARTPRRSPLFYILGALLPVVGALPTAFGGDIVKANNADALNSTTSWSGGVVPTGADTIVVNNTINAARNSSLGANLAVYGIRYATDTIINTDALRINSTGGYTLSLGAGGIDLSAASSGARFRLDAKTDFTADQEWKVGTGVRLTMTSADITGSSGNATVTGAGTVAFDTGVNGTLGSAITFRNTTIQVNFATSNPIFDNANNSYSTLNLLNGRARFADIGNVGGNSSAGTGSVTTLLGGNGTSGVFEFSGTTTTTDRGFNMDKRSTGSGIDVTTAGVTLTVLGDLTTTAGVNTTVSNAWNFGGAGNLKISGAILAKTDSSGGLTNLAQNGTGTLTLAGNNTYTGTTTISSGTLRLGDGGTTGKISTLSTITNNGTFAINRSNAVEQGVDFSSAAISGTGGLTQMGSGTTTLTAANLYTGATTISAGTLGLASSERIANTSNLILAGGTFALNGHTETLGTLDLNGNSTIDLGSGGKLIFNDSSAVSWDTGMTLTIVGTLGADSIRFGSTSGALTDTQLGLFRMSGFAGFALDNNGYLTAAAIPEPSTYALLAGVAGLGLVIYRRRRDRQAAATVKVTTTL